MENNIEWFKNEILQKLIGYDILFKDFLHGEFGSLKRVEFDNKELVGNVDFWSQGWVNIYLYSLVKEKELMNILLEPSETEKIKHSFDQLILIINRKF